MVCGLEEGLRPAAGAAADTEEFAIARKHRSRAKGFCSICEWCQADTCSRWNSETGGFKWGELQRIREKLAVTAGRTVAEVEVIAEAVQVLDGRGLRANPLKVGDLAGNSEHARQARKLPW
jgi:hypothetical protein